MAGKIIGRWAWSGDRDAEGHRNYHITTLVEVKRGDGPAVALQTPGLPIPGSWWIFGNDIDLWAWCTPETSIKAIVEEGQPNVKGNGFHVTQTFTTKPPPPNMRRCTDTPITDPIMEPQKVSGSFSKYSQEVRYDRFGLPILNSAFEFIKGPSLEFEDCRPTIKVEQNVLDLQLPLIDSMTNRVNAYWLWGLPPRTIRLSNTSWDRKWYGSCYLYYTRTFEFEIRAEGWDRILPDAGTKALIGSWDLDPLSPTYQTYVISPNIDPTNPNNYIRYRGIAGDSEPVILDGNGRPALSVVGGMNSRSIVSISLNTNETSLFFGLVKVKTLNVHKLLRGLRVRIAETNTGTTRTLKPQLDPGNPNPAPPSVAPNPPLTDPFLQGSQAGGAGTYDGWYNVWWVEDPTTFYIPFKVALTVRNRLAADPGPGLGDPKTGLCGRVVWPSGRITFPGTIFVEHYDEADFLQLGIPTTF